MEQKAGRHYGMGFVVSPRLNGNVKATHRVSDRVCWIDLAMRLDRDMPAQRAMDFAFGDKVKSMKPR